MQEWHLRCAQSGRVVRGRKEHISNRASNYPVRGTSELSEITVGDLVTPKVGLFSSLRETVKLRAGEELTGFADTGNKA